MTSKLKKEDLKKTDSKEIIKKVFDPAGKEFENIEMIMQVVIIKSIRKDHSMTCIFGNSSPLS